MVLSPFEPGMGILLINLATGKHYWRPEDVETTEDQTHMEELLCEKNWVESGSLGSGKQFVDSVIYHVRFELQCILFVSSCSFSRALSVIAFSMRIGPRPLHFAKKLISLECERYDAEGALQNPWLMKCGAQAGCCTIS